MAHEVSVRRTGAAIVGVVPPPGTPFPQQSVGAKVWMGRAGDLRDPEVLREKVRYSRLQRDLRIGHRRNAVRRALDIDLGCLPDDDRTRRPIAVLRSVGYASEPRFEGDRERMLRDTLELLARGGGPPPTLLDELLAPGARIAPDVVERVWLERFPDIATPRLRLLLIRRAGQDLLAAPSRPALDLLRQRVVEARKLELHSLLVRWLDAVDKAATKLEAGMQPGLAVPSRVKPLDDSSLLELIKALGPNLALLESQHAEFQEALRTYFESTLPTDVQRNLVRLSFSAWTRLLDVREGRASAELISFSGQAASFRQVFELLFERSLFGRLRRDWPEADKQPLVKGVLNGTKTWGIGVWKGLLFSTPRGGQKKLQIGAQSWFRDSDALGALRDNDFLKTGLDDLLRVRLNGLPHDEEAARTRADELLETVTSVGFGVTDPKKKPVHGKGLLAELLKVVP